MKLQNKIKRRYNDLQTRERSQSDEKLTGRHHCAFSQVFVHQRRIFSTTLALPLAPKTISLTTRTHARTSNERDVGRRRRGHMTLEDNFFFRHVIGKVFAGKSLLSFDWLRNLIKEAQNPVTSAWFKRFSPNWYQTWAFRVTIYFKVGLERNFTQHYRLYAFYAEVKFTSFVGNDHAQIANHVAFSRLCHDRVNGFATALFGPFDSRAKLEKSLRLNQKNSKHLNRTVKF